MTINVKSSRFACKKQLKMNIVLTVIFFSFLQNEVRTFSENDMNVDDTDLSIPLIDDGGAPLVAMLDTSKINRKLKKYIKTLMKGLIQTNLREQIQDIVFETLEGNTTMDFIRNVTLHDLSLMTAKEELIKERKQNVQVDDSYETTGREFHLGFLNSHNKGGYLYLYMVSQSDGVCNIHIPRLSQNSTLKVGSRSLNSYKINPIVFMDQQGIQRNGIHVKCNIPVSLYGLTFTGNEVDGFLVLPTQVLGKDYIVASFTPRPNYNNPTKHSSFGIVGVSKETNITIHFRMTGGSINYENKQYRKDEILNINLNRLDTYYISHDYDLSGTIITTSSPVAVMSGVRTSFLRNGWGNHMEEMILPNHQLGRKFIVPKLYDSQCNLRILTSKQTHVRTYNNISVQYKTIQPGNFVEMENYKIFTLEATFPIQVQIYCNGESTKYDAFMVTIPSVKQFKSRYRFPVVFDFKNKYSVTKLYITIIIKSSAVAGITLNQSTDISLIGLSNITLGNDAYSILAVEMTEGVHEIFQKDAIPFGLIVYGRTSKINKGNGSGYGYVAGLKLNAHK